MYPIGCIYIILIMIIKSIIYLEQFRMHFNIVYIIIHNDIKLQKANVSTIKVFECSLLKNISQRLPNLLVSLLAEH